MLHAHTIEHIKQAIHAHGPWKLKLAVAVETGVCEMTPEKAQTDDCCEFGKWIHGSEIPNVLQDGMPYQVIRRLHAEFHQCAGKVIKHINEGELASAKELLHGEFEGRSQTLIVALNKWKRELEADIAA